MSTGGRLFCKGKNPAKRFKKTPASELITQAPLTKVLTNCQDALLIAGCDAKK
jgi:hypothetical protein